MFVVLSFRNSEVEVCKFNNEEEIAEYAFGKFINFPEAEFSFSIFRDWGALVSFCDSNLITFPDEQAIIVEPNTDLNSDLYEVEYKETYNMTQRIRSAVKTKLAEYKELS